MRGHTHTEWLRVGTTVYALNAEGTNRFSAQVQGGWATDGRLRTDAEELEANARLMAAAPQLLEALQDLVEVARVLEPKTIGDQNDQESRISTAEAAIAKATGEPA